MTFKAKGFRVWLLCFIYLPTAFCLNFSQAADFTDANWISMNPELNRTVSAAVVDSSSNLYIGGDFTLAGESLVNHIAKWNGTNWSPLDTGMNGTVYALAVSGGELYAGGDFTMAGGSNANYVAKWDGTQWMPLEMGMNDYVYALAVLDSDVYAGGRFTTAGGSNINYVAKWNGTAWTALGSGMSGNTNNPFYIHVRALAVSGSDLYAGGFFTTAGGVTVSNIAKWNGSSWTALGSGVGGATYPYVSALVVSGGNLYAGGYFTTASGSAANYIAKWNGSSWSALGSGMGGGGSYSPNVFALTVSGTNLYAGGLFTTAGGGNANHIAKWNGNSWSSLGSGMSGGVSNMTYVSALAATGNDVYAGGDFSVVGGSEASFISKWNGNKWTALGSGMNSNVLALAVSSSDLYAGGAFTTAGGSSASLIAKWNGSTWSSLGSGVAGIGSFVYVLAASGGDLYTGGLFATAGGSNANYIAKWDGSSWNPLGSGLSAGDPPLMTPGVLALAVAGSELYVGGRFLAKAAGGIIATNIAKWNGSSWSALGSGMNNYGDVRALVVSGSDLYAGGFFTTAGGIAANYIAKWNGTSWNPLGSGMNGPTYCLALSGDDLYAGGLFTGAGGTNAQYIAKWNGINWTPLGSGMNSPVYALATSGSDLYAGGSFTNVGGRSANFIAKWNGSSWSPLGSGISGGLSNQTYVAALAVSGSDLYVGGNFSKEGGKGSRYIARAYVFSLPALSIHPSASELTVSWASANTADFTLEQSAAAGFPTWFPNSTAITDDGTNKSINIPATNTSRFFRLRRP